MEVGTKATQTVQNISMLKVISLASLKLSGSFIEGQEEAETRQQANIVQNPQKPTTEPATVLRMILNQVQSQHKNQHL